MRHEVHIGDELLVEGELFIVMGVMKRHNAPAILDVKQPIELIEE